MSRGLGDVYKRQIFNIADSSICIGVALLILFYSKDASVAFNAIGGDSAKTESEAK